MLERFDVWTNKKSAFPTCTSNLFVGGADLKEAGLGSNGGEDRSFLMITIPAKTIPHIGCSAHLRE
jgi:hypothetical protein